MRRNTDGLPIFDPDIHKNANFDCFLTKHCPLVDTCHFGYKHYHQPLKQGFGPILQTETGGPGLLITGLQHLQQNSELTGR